MSSAPTGPLARTRPELPPVRPHGRAAAREEVRAPPAAESFDDIPGERPTSPVFIIDPTLRDRGVLIETTGVFAGRPHLLGALVTVGRGVSAVLRLDDDALSRTHARIVLGSDGVYVLEDAESLNGCYVGDRRVRRQALADGDRVRFGSNVEMRFQLVTDDEKRALVRLYEAGLRDALTGLANRKQLEEQLRAELSFSRRHGTELSVLMVDVDRFKGINDAHGHLVGDAVLKHVASVLSTTVRAEDLVARFGGEEFLVIARATSLDRGQQLGERLRAALERMPFTADGLHLSVTASFGVSSALEEPNATSVSLIGRADERLYRAKAEGRNRVIAD